MTRVTSFLGLPFLLAMFMFLVGGTASATASSFTGTTTAPGSDKTFKVGVSESGVGALTIPATGAVTVNGQPVTYTVDPNDATTPGVTLTNMPAAGDVVVVNGSTAGGDGSDYTANVSW
jgi:hypothetical protein